MVRLPVEILPALTFSRIRIAKRLFHMEARTVRFGLFFGGRNPHIQLEAHTRFGLLGVSAGSPEQKQQKQRRIIQYVQQHGHEESVLQPGVTVKYAGSGFVRHVPEQAEQPRKGLHAH